MSSIGDHLYWRLLTWRVLLSHKLQVTFTPRWNIFVLLRRTAINLTALISLLSVDIENLMGGQHPLQILRFNLKGWFCRSGPQVDFQKLTAWASPTTPEDYQDLLARFLTLAWIVSMGIEQKPERWCKTIILSFNQWSLTIEKPL